MDAKIYYNDIEINGIKLSERLYDLNIPLRNDGKQYILESDLDKLFNDILNKICENKIITELGDINIYPDFKFELDKTIYEFNENVY